MSTAMAITSQSGQRRQIERACATGSGAIDHTYTPVQPMRLVRVTLHMSAAPTTSEALVIKIDSDLGAGYDTTVFSNDLSSGSTTDVLITRADLEDILQGEVLVITYTNTDAGTWGLTVTGEVL